MTNPKYRKGVYYERKTMEILRKIGYYCIRSSGSHSKLDVIAFFMQDDNPDELPLIRAIQVKSGSSYYKNDLKKIEKLNLPHIVSKELWIFEGYYEPEILLVGEN